MGGWWRWLACTGALALGVGCVGLPPPAPSEDEGSTSGTSTDGTASSGGTDGMTSGVGPVPQDDSGSTWPDDTWGSSTTVPHEGPWQHELTVSGHVLGPLDDVPVRVSFDPSVLVEPIGPDELYLFDGGGQPLPFEIETWTGGRVDLWVRVSVVEANPTSVWMGYGRREPPELLPSTDVWGEDALGVWHLSEGLADASEQGNAGVSMGATPTEGYCGGGHAYDGSVYDELPTIGGAQRGTVQMWFRAAPRQLDLQDGLAMLFHGAAEKGAEGFGPVGETYVGLRTQGGMDALQFRAFGLLGIQDVSTTAIGPWLDDQWHQVTATWDGPQSFAGLYLDGQLIADDATLPVFVPFMAFLRLGGNAMNPARGLVGALDEVRFYDRFFTSIRVQIESEAQRPDFVAVGPAQPDL